VIESGIQIRLDTAAHVRAGMVASTCSGVVDITHLAFKPPEVAPGGSSTAHMSARNCTDMPVKATSVWIGSFTGDVAGCPVIDPVGQPADFAPNGTVRSKITYEVPSGCGATDLQFTVRISEGGTLFAEKTADLAILKTP
jgi:hypothetical protein